ncbi:cytochrome P450 [Pisolithus tinctorius]|nr:cytochrome P450 [Pisolithus tinctorius]
MDPSSLLERIHDHLLAATRSVTPLDFAAVIAAIWALRGAVRAARGSIKTTRLHGPPGADLIFGASKQIIQSPDIGALYEAWTKEYGAVYAVPTTLGGKKIMLCDPRGLAHFFARESWTYVLPDSTRLFYEQTAIQYGRGVLWAEGKTTKGTGARVQPKCYKEHHSYILHLRSQDLMASGLQDSLMISVLSTESHAPTARTNLIGELQRSLEDISMKLLVKMKKEKEEEFLMRKRRSRSLECCIALSNILRKVKANDPNSDIYLTHAEVLAQMRGLLIVGYETMAVTLTFALLDLAGNPDIQNKLRQELVMFGEEPTYDQLQSSLPYLDAVIHETLRVHPALIDIVRVAMEDDVIPLSEPLATESGEVVNSITVARGTQIDLPDCGEKMQWISVQNGGWKRWYSEEGARYSGIPTHIDVCGWPGTCIGKGFALVQLKAVMSVLVRNFVFEMRDGPDTRVELSRGLLLRPRIAGEQGIDVPLRVRRYEG